MRLGCCGSLEEAAVIKAAGFDFLEITVPSVIKGDEPDAAWEKTAPNPAQLPLPIEAANVLVTPDHPIVGPRRDAAGLQDYMQRVVKRAERLGIQRLVFGSGGARRRPDGVTEAEAFEHLAEFTRMAGEVCTRHSIILVIEHLYRDGTNTLNKLIEARQLCEYVNHPSVQMLVDSYHFGMEKEDGQAVLDLGGSLRHVHVAEPAGRTQPGAPATPAEGFDFDDFFCLLRKIGYDERISVESSWVPSLAEGAAACVKFLRAAWERAGECES